jgi:hypothetical protein
MPIKIEARHTFLWSTPTQSAVISFLEKKNGWKSYEKSSQENLD